MIQTGGVYRPKIKINKKGGTKLSVVPKASISNNWEKEKMGRKKLEIKRIEDKNARQVTFSKRRNGLLKKAKELAILCDVEVGAIVISNRGKHFNYASNNSLPEMVQRYNQCVEAEAEPGPSTFTNILDKQQDQSSKYAGFLTSGELLQIVERELEEPFVDHLSVSDLQNLENQFEDALTRTRSTKTHQLVDFMTSLKEKEKSLEEEKKLLEEQVIRNKKLREKQKKLLIDLNVVGTDKAEGTKDC